MVFVNPVSGNGVAKEKWREICKLLEVNNFDFEYYFTEPCGKTITHVRTVIENGYQNLIVIGGDGTLNEVLNGIMTQARFSPTQIKVGIIPVGTGNDWIRTAGIPNSIEKAVQLILRNKTVNQDVGWALHHIDGKTKKRYFINTAGTGLDSIVVDQTNKQKSTFQKSTIAYSLNLLKAFTQYKPVYVTLEDNNGIKLSGKMLNFSVGIGRYNGGGMLPFPDANPTDGLYNVLFISNMSKLKILLSIHKLFKGTLASVKEVQYLHAEKIILHSKSPIFLETDGEVIGYSPFEFGIVPLSFCYYGNSIS